MIIKVTNPYWDEEYEVMEDSRYFAQCCDNIKAERDDFIIFHTQDGRVLTINPRNFASIQEIRRSSRK